MSCWDHMPKGRKRSALVRGASCPRMKTREHKAMTRTRPWSRGLLGVALVAVLLAGAGLHGAEPLPSPREMADSLTDLWGEAALRQPGGPSYEFFKDLLPPLRYANTAF